MNLQSANLSIHYNAAPEVYNKIITSIYEQMEGWLGFGKGGDEGEEGIPYWYSYNETEKHICASVEPSGLLFTGLMNDTDWTTWINKMKYISSKTFGYKVIEPETES